MTLSKTLRKALTKRGIRVIHTDRCTMDGGRKYVNAHIIFKNEFGDKELQVTEAGIRKQIRKELYNQGKTLNDVRIVNVDLVRNPAERELRLTNRLGLVSIAEA